MNPNTLLTDRVVFDEVKRRFPGALVRITSNLPPMYDGMRVNICKGLKDVTVQLEPVELTASLDYVGELIERRATDLAAWRNPNADALSG